ncbi:related to sexual differentiation process protein [Cephalotrichum gorgonifer]|uniref:Related to sexual differentiation process protein n=1 Tax=Cephalotrichum gorgonifer TaxID=2041049 RepID=A0AAE8MU27_9PEZI|nr:related to sexual differentiation process protein [Cephalotrichum gorgonifer]
MAEASHSAEDLEFTRPLEEKKPAATSGLAQFTLESSRDGSELLNATESDLLMKQVHKQHAKDPNFPITIIERIEEFLGNDAILGNPENYEQLIKDMKIEVALITDNSPYAEVRAVVSNHDDPDMPASTIRAWFIGILFSCCISFINSFFDIRLPTIFVASTVPQLLAYPLGKLLERTLPDRGITLLGVRHSLNPGPFNKKEHMLIAIMSNVAKSTPYTNYIVWIQYLPQYFNQPWAISVGYQLLIALSTNFIGYGLAGLCRRFLVYPAYCVWPSSLVTIALNSAFHDASTESASVAGPLKSIWKMSRLRFFLWAFGLMFVYFWFPNYIFAALSYFSWMTWVAPDNGDLARISGTHSGLSVNPVPTLDWNILSYMVDPLMVPFFSTFNLFLGAFCSTLIIVAMYYTNTYNTAYLPINSNLPFDHFGNVYRVSSIIDERGIFDGPRYEQYSPPFLSAANVVLYMCYFSVYTASVAYGVLYHRHEIMLGLRGIGSALRRRKTRDYEGKTADEADRATLDVHSRLMACYKEVPEWWYMICLAIAVAVGVAGIVSWPTNTTPAVVPYGIALCLVFVVPLGIIKSMTGVEVTLNVLAEFIGGVWVEGNAVAMSFFKSYGYVTCAHALSFSADLKLAHYLKIAPRLTFFAQMVPTLVSTLVSLAVLQYQLRIEGVCTPEAPFRFTCPGVNTFFTAAVLWGTIGPKKMWGSGGQYVETLAGFPLGILVVVFFWGLGLKWPRSRIIRNAHPVVMLMGALNWAPYNLAYIWPAVPVSAFSWLFLKKRFVGFWSKYNYATSAALSCAIAISGITMFFSLQIFDIKPMWWGNTVVSQGCDGTGGCVLKTLSEGEYFGPRIGEFA